MFIVHTSISRSLSCSSLFYLLRHSSFKIKGKPKHSYTAAAKTFLPTLTLNKLTAQINVNSDHPIHENARSAVDILHSSFDTSAPQSPRFLNSCPYSSQNQWEGGGEGTHGIISCADEILDPQPQRTDDFEGEP